MAAQLGISAHYISRSDRRGLLGAIVKYPLQTIETIRLLRRSRPQVVLVQNPPSIAPFLVAAYGAVTGTRFIVDAHSDAMMSPLWTRPRWLYRRLARRALATIVTNEHFASTIREWGGRALVIQDIPAQFPEGRFPLEPGFNVVVVNTFAADEPLEAVLAAADELADVTFHITGDPGRGSERLPPSLPQNVRFTGFLPDDDYYGLLRSSEAVMCLTTRDHTMQRGACEALSLGTPIITSDWPILTDYFSRGTVYVDNTPSGIRDGVLEMHRTLNDHRRGIVELRTIQQERWERARAALIRLLDGSGDAGEAMGG